LGKFDKEKEVPADYSFAEVDCQEVAEEPPSDVTCVSQDGEG